MTTSKSLLLYVFVLLFLASEKSWLNWWAVEKGSVDLDRRELKEGRVSFCSGMVNVFMLNRARNAG